MTKLYDLANAYQFALDNMYDRETGEINDEVLAQFNTLSDDINEKGIAVATYIRNLKGDHASLQNEMDILKKRMASFNSRKNKVERDIDWFTAYLKTNMENCNLKEIPCNHFGIKIKKNPPKPDITDETLIPDQYINVIIEKKPDRKKILDDLKSGVEVPGAILVQGTRLDIR